MPDGGNPKKRARDGDTEKTTKRFKGGQKYVRPKHANLRPGMVGIFVTCDMGRERRSMDEIRDLVSECVSELYPASQNDEATSGDIEASIEEELSALRTEKKDSPLQNIDLDTQCLTFLSMPTSYNAVDIVQKVSRDTLAKGKQCRWVKRLTPVSATCTATEEALAELAKTVLKPHFHEGVSRKFAIRPVLRSHNVLDRDKVIQLIAKTVGEGHKVDLKEYDRMILVKVFKSVAGIAVVDSDFDTLKRFNLAEINS